MKKLLLKTMLLLLALVAGSTSAWADEESVTFSEQGYTNQQTIESYTGTAFSINFSKGTNSNAPKYYTSGTAIRAYGGNYFTVSSSNTITKIVLTFGSSDGSNAITTDVETYSDGTWTGSGNSVTFTIGGTSGNRRIAGIAVTYTAGGGDSDTYTVTYNANGATSGTAPTDEDSPYESGATVTVLGNTGSLAKTGYTFDGWNTANDGSGTSYNAGATFEITAATTLYAKWIINTHDVTMPEENEYGTYTASATDDVSYGADVTLTYTPKSGYESYRATWSVNGDEIDGNTFSMPDEDVTVTVAVESYVQPTEFDIDLNDTFFGTSYGGTASGITDDAPVSAPKNNVTVTYAGSGNHYINASQIRFYPNNKLTFEAPTGYNITNIVFTSAGTWGATISANTGAYASDSKTWAGEATSVIFTGSGTSRCDISKVTVTLALPSSVVTPTFTVAAGTYEEAQNVKVGNYDEDYIYFYTTDGTTPDCDGELNATGTSSAYNHSTGIAITETTTLKIVAVDEDGNKSSVATAAYTIQLPYTTIAEVKALASGTGFKLNLTGAQVVYIDAAKKNIYVRDASGAIDLYNNSGFTTSLTTGDFLSGIIEGTYSPYRNLPEITSIADISVLTSTSNSAVVAKVIEGTTAAIAANLCDLVKIEGTEITESSGKYYVGESSDIQLYDNFSVGYTVTTGKTVDVSGIATVYNTTYELFPRFVTDIVYVENSEEVSIGSAGIATFCSTNALDFTSVDAIAVYIAAASDGYAHLTPIQKVPANTGVILMNALGMGAGAVATVNVPYLDGEADDVSSNELVGVTARTQVDATSGGKYNYILSNEDAGIGFYKATDGKYLAANKAYLSTSVDAGVRDFLGFTDEGADGINMVQGEGLKVQDCYDLSGRRVVKPTKGLYIVSGKKVVK